MSRNMGVISVVLLCAILAVLIYPYFQEYRQEQARQERRVQEYQAELERQEQELMVRSVTVINNELATTPDNCNRAHHLYQLVDVGKSDVPSRYKGEIAEAVVRCIAGRVTRAAVIAELGLDKDFLPLLERWGLKR